MTKEQKLKPFERYLAFIENKEIVDAVIVMLGYAPDYFWTIPASSSGKYHPQFAQGIGGLVRHTQAALITAFELMSNPILTKFSQAEKDVVYASLILHDTYKNGIKGSKWTSHYHPQIAATFFYEFVPSQMLKEPYRSAIYGAILKHMGIWGGTKNNKLPLPQTELERFVHLCDFVASRQIDPTFIWKG